MNFIPTQAYTGRRTTTDHTNGTRMKKRPNKQHDARAASFKRIAKTLRAESKTYGNSNVREVARQIAKVFDNEAKLLRSMR
jgi:Rod binding domain-containing protein